MAFVLEKTETLEAQGLIKAKPKTFFPEDLVETATDEELRNLAVENTSDSITGIKARRELIKRGKDNIKERIHIKKSFKLAVESYELSIAEIEKQEIQNERRLSLYKSKLLTTIAILDKLQLEWQKYDLALQK